VTFPKHVFKIFIYYLYIYLQLQHWLMVSLEKFMSHQCVCVILVQFYNLIRFLYNSSNNNNNIHLQHQANDNNYKHLFNQFNNNKLVGSNQQPQQQQWVPQPRTHLHAHLSYCLSMLQSIIIKQKYCLSLFFYFLLWIMTMHVILCKLVYNINRVW
jgi:hypothetical protein